MLRLIPTPLTACALATLLAAALLAAAPSRAQIADTPEDLDNFGRATASGDFNGDGRMDLAIGVPYESVGTVLDAGAVHVLYGTDAGLSDVDDQFWHQNSPGLGDAAEARDHFGASLAVGDFNGDGYDDLALGSPNERRGALTNVGQVHVLYGSAAGLTGAGSFYLPAIPSAQPNYQVGFALAAGDFDGDGYDELVIGAPGRDFGGVRDGGLVAVLAGSPSGVQLSGYRVWHQNSPGLADAVEADDYFGHALAAGDFNDDGRDDLAIGVPYEDVGGLEDAGAVHVLYGSAVGLTALGDQLWYQGVAGLEGAPEAHDLFGHALVAGDFNGDGRDDLAIGVPSENVGAVDDAGAVNVLYGGGAALTTNGDQIWYQDVGTVAGVSGEFDYFGWALTAGDFDGDSRDDLAVGVPGEDAGGAGRSGAANVLYGTAAGLDDAGNQLWSQASPGVVGHPEIFDYFGWALAAGDFDGSGAADLAVGVIGEDVGDVNNAGAANVLYSDGSGLSSDLNEILYQGLALRVAGASDDVAARRGAGPDPTAPPASAAASTAASGLLPAAPNPFATRTTIGYEVAETGLVRLAVYDLLGREVAVLADGTVDAGRHEAVLDGAALPSGTYLVRLTAAGATQAHRISLVR